MIHTFSPTEILMCLIAEYCPRPWLDCFVTWSMYILTLKCEKKIQFCSLFDPKSFGEEILDWI